jgi:hypothetical protein
MGGLARDQFSHDYSGCSGTVLGERPQFRPGPEPNVVHSGWEAYEVVGCNHHALYVCDSAGYDASGVLSPAYCSGRPWCDPVGCDSDYPSAARDSFVTDNSWPRDRVTATQTPTVPLAAPPDIAADPERLKVWTETHAREIRQSQAQTQVSVNGCGATASFSCTKQSPSAPLCTRTK